MPPPTSLGLSVLRAAPAVWSLYLLPACGGNPPPSEHPSVATLDAYDCQEGLALLVFGERGASSVEVRWGDRSSRLELVRRDGGLVHSDGLTTLMERGEEASLRSAGSAPAHLPAYRARAEDRARGDRRCVPLGLWQ